MAPTIMMGAPVLRLATYCRVSLTKNVSRIQTVVEELECDMDKCLFIRFTSPLLYIGPPVNIHQRYQYLKR